MDYHSANLYLFKKKDFPELMGTKRVDIIKVDYDKIWDAKSHWSHISMHGPGKIGENLIYSRIYIFKQLDDNSNAIKRILCHEDIHMILEKWFGVRTALALDLLERYPYMVSNGD